MIALVALLLIVLYDWILTLRDEIALIVPTRWTVVKALYLVVSPSNEIHIRRLSGCQIRLVTPSGLLVANYRERLLSDRRGFS